MHTDYTECAAMLAQPICKMSLLSDNTGAFTSRRMKTRGTLAMFVLGFRLGPLAIGTTAILMPRDTGVVRGARKGLASAV